MKTVQDYLSLPYTILLRRDDEGDVIARIAELPGCVTHAPSEAEALEALREVQIAWLEQAIKTGVDVPEPAAKEAGPSGKWLQRVPRTLHARLTALAQAEGVSLNQLVTSLLSEAIGRKAGEARRRVAYLETGALFRVVGSGFHTPDSILVGSSDASGGFDSPTISISSPTASAGQFVTLPSKGRHGVS